MQIRTFLDLPNEWEPQIALLYNQPFGSSWDPRDISRRWKHRYPPLADYMGLCAVEGGNIVASLGVRRFPFRTRSRESTCSGLGGVATLPSHGRRGFARSLIEEAHRRERAAGSSFCLLYTGRSMVAHDLYESLGYRDVMDFPRAVRLIPHDASPPRRGWLWRKGRRSDRQAIEELHTRYAQGKFGFTRAGHHWWPGTTSNFVLEWNGSIRGYANLTKRGKVWTCFEGFACSGTERAALLKGLESETAGKWLLLGAGVLRDLRPFFGWNAFRFSKGSYEVLMA